MKQKKIKDPSEMSVKELEKLIKKKKDEDYEKWRVENSKKSRILTEDYCTFGLDGDEINDFFDDIPSCDSEDAFSKKEVDNMVEKLQKRIRRAIKNSLYVIKKGTILTFDVDDELWATNNGDYLYDTNFIEANSKEIQ